MRHSTIILTMARYGHVFKSDETAALAQLPDLETPAWERMRQTGTDAATNAPADLAQRLAFSSAKPQTPKDSGRLNMSRPPASMGAIKNPAKCGETAFHRGKTERAGFEPAIQSDTPYNGLANRRLQPLGHLSSDLPMVADFFISVKCLAGAPNH